MSLINREALYEKACGLEAQALSYVGKIVNDETRTDEWRIWSAILAERTAFKHDIFDAPEVLPEPKWIPCSDAPDTDRNVFIARGERDNMSVCIGHYNHEYKQWYVDRDWFAMCSYDGLYWCEMPPLPEPYREEGEQ